MAVKSLMSFGTSMQVLYNLYCYSCYFEDRSQNHEEVFVHVDEATYQESYPE